MNRPAIILTKRQETLLFAFLAFILVPAISIGVVAGYGFCIWMYQILAGPPVA
ncbi:MAG TPA: periplasmic nitrate reductase, NapE protein [Azospirillaceae bacterium]|nr:periplasmic nitrate reductase, NapE protein [Azospirillaceae bacterium]